MSSQRELQKQTKRPRDKNFTSKEDEQLCYSWVAISMNPITGRDQKSEELWRKIGEHFRENFPKQFPEAPIYQRDDDMSFYRRWSTLQGVLSKYCGYVEQAKRRNTPSGSDAHDMLLLANKLFDEGTGKKFAYHACWKIVRDAPKWQQKLKADELKKKGKGNSTNNKEKALDECESGEEDDTRPTGRKKEKAIEKGEKATAASVSKSLEALMELQKDRMEKAERAREEDLMRLDLSTIKNPVFRAHFERLQNELAARLVAAYSIDDDEEVEEVEEEEDLI